MARALAHRGVDPGAVWTGRGVGLCGAAAPASAGGGTLHLVLDGRITNAGAVRAALGGTLAPDGGDAALLLQAWQRWGPACLPRIEGAFAFGLHDAAEGALWLVRDRLGVKPLHHAILSDGAVLFASELKGLLAHPLLRTAPDMAAIEAYLALGYVPDDTCLAQGVSKLAAGHYLRLRVGHPVPAPVRWSALGGERGARAGALAERMGAAVAAAMPGAGDAGALLRGGVDDAAVVALMAERSPGAVRTYAIGYGEEAGAPPLAVARFATQHRHKTMGPGEGRGYDEPFADPAAWGLARLCALARNGAAVALAGDGGDLVFGGQRGRAEWAHRLLPARARRAMGRLWPPLGRSPDEARAVAVERIGEAERMALYSAAGRAALGSWRAEAVSLAALRAAPGRDAAERAYQAECAVRLPGEVLALLDRAGMAAGLDLRAPWADAALLAFLAALPATARGRKAMRRALRQHLPRAIPTASQTGCPPVALWLRDPFAAEVGRLARRSALAETGWFDGDAIARLVAEHAAARADHSRLLWPLLMLDRSLAGLFGLGPRAQAG
jgi:asparagine synthase (glutamine-hydrolysing)